MHIVLGVGGGIAAYKAAELARLLMQQGHQVQVVMTAGGQEFVEHFSMITAPLSPIGAPSYKGASSSRAN